MTAQIPDQLMIDGESWLLLAAPLGPYLREIAAPEFYSRHTGNWSGYTASWSIIDGWLMLDDVEGTVMSDAGELVDVTGTAALPGAQLPLVARWVSGQLRAATGDIVRYVHAGYESRWEREIVIDVEAGRVTGRQELAPVSALGAAGPYLLHEHLLGDLSGGAFGVVIAATDLEGRPLVAKYPRRKGGDWQATEAWRYTPVGKRPSHIPAVAFREGIGGELWMDPLEADAVVRVLELEAEILERDGGRLLPHSYGVWEHDLSGRQVLVMERLEGRPPSSPSDIAVILSALQDAVDRGTFDAHGDIKLEHIFIDADRVRICDPAPRFDEPGRRAFTAMYNPRGFEGVAADVAACATILRYFPGLEGAGWRWCAAVLDSTTPPQWATTHRGARDVLVAELANPIPVPPRWEVPRLPGRHGPFSRVPAVLPRSITNPVPPPSGATGRSWVPPRAPTPAANPARFSVFTGLRVGIHEQRWRRQSPASPDEEWTVWAPHPRGGVTVVSGQERGFPQFEVIDKADLLRWNPDCGIGRDGDIDELAAQLQVDFVPPREWDPWVPASRIVVEGGTIVNAGPDRVRRLPWTVTHRSDDRVGIAYPDSGEPVTFDDMDLAEFFRHNPSCLIGQAVRHPAPPHEMAADGWLVRRLEDGGASLLLEVHTSARWAASIVPTDAVLALSLDDLSSRLEVTRPS